SSPSLQLAIATPMVNKAKNKLFFSFVISKKFVFRVPPEYYKKQKARNCVLSLVSEGPRKTQTYK
ncbi:hypothetical protein, partial [Bacteroides xylanisolvens]|uniref:hypothetical protein n=1 Tax=Bacteroides xylanisolvens TaxID=371601 RepID=UPI00195CE522